jgi:acyl carrier protein
MLDLTAHVITILQNYQRDPAASVNSDTTFQALDIDVLDLPMIFLDIEDAFALYIPYEDDIEDVTTVAGLVTWVQSRQESQAALAQLRAALPRSKSTWMTTGAERRR